MSEISYVDAPSAEPRRESLKRALARTIRGWRPLASDVLGAETPIDWVGIDQEGRAWIALVAAGPDQDLALVATGLAQRDWLAKRLPDWVQLAPEAGLSPEAGVGVLLLAPAFRQAALTAARAAPDLHPARLRFLRDADGVTHALIESSGDFPPAWAPKRSNGASGFRSGLSAEELDLSPEELAEFSR